MNFPPPTERQARVIWLAVAGLAVAALAGLVVAMVWALGQVVRLLSPVLWPLAIAGVVAYLLDPVVGLIQRRGASRGQAILSVFGLALVVVFALGASVVPQLVREVRDLSARIPSYAGRVETRVTEWVNHPPALVGQVRGLLSSGRGSHRSSGETGGTNNAPGISGTNDSAMSGGGTAVGPGAAGDAFGRDQYRVAANWIAKTLPEARDLGSGPTQTRGFLVRSSCRPGSIPSLCVLLPPRKGGDLRPMDRRPAREGFRFQAGVGICSRLH